MKTPNQAADNLSVLMWFVYYDCLICKNAKKLILDSSRKWNWVLKFSFLLAIGIMYARGIVIYSAIKATRIQDHSCMKNNIFQAWFNSFFHFLYLVSLWKETTFEKVTKTVIGRKFYCLLANGVHLALTYLFCSKTNQIIGWGKKIKREILPQRKVSMFVVKIEIHFQLFIINDWEPFVLNHHLFKTDVWKEQ